MEEQKLEKRTDIVITNNTAKYTVSHQSSTQGTLIGTFVFRPFLTPVQKLEAGRERRRLLGEFADLASSEEKYIAFCLAELHQRIITAPSFWNTNDILPGGNIEESLIYKVAGAALDAENIYKEQKELEKAELIKKALEESEKILKQRAEAKAEELKKAKEKFEADGLVEEDLE